MSSKGLSELYAFRDELEKLEKDPELMETLIKELAARMLRKVIKATPVGKRTMSDVLDEGGEKVRFKSGKRKGLVRQRVTRVGGTLRRGWTARSNEEAEGGGKVDVEDYLKAVRVTKAGDTYQIVIENPVHYASYVEYGHRQTPGRFVPAIGKRLKAAWVDGQFMMTFAAADIERMAPQILERKIKAHIEEALNAK